MPDRDEELIAALQRAHEAFNSGDFDAAIELAHPDVEFVRPGNQASLRGADAFRAWMEPDAFEEQVVEPLEFHVAGDKVLVRQHTRARGAASGIVVEIDSWAVWSFDGDGLITRLEFYLPHEGEQAREAAGLR